MIIGLFFITRVRVTLSAPRLNVSRIDDDVLCSVVSFRCHTVRMAACVCILYRAFCFEMFLLFLFFFCFSFSMIVRLPLVGGQLICLLFVSNRRYILFFHSDSPTTLTHVICFILFFLLFLCLPVDFVCVKQTLIARALERSEIERVSEGENSKESK